MKERDLIAVIESIEVAIHFPEYEFVEHSGYTAVLGRHSPNRLRRSDREMVLLDGLQRQKMIESLMCFGTVIPVLPGTNISVKEVPDMILCNKTRLDKLFHYLQNKVQFQILVDWNEEFAVRNFGFTSTAARQDRINSLRQECAQYLNVDTFETLELPNHEDTIFNNAVLIHQESEPKLDRAIKFIDAIWTEGLTIRMIGPSPAVSFGSLGLKRIETKKINAALDAFGILALPQPEELRALRRQALREANATLRSQIDFNAEILKAVSTLGTIGRTVHLAFTWREGQSSSFTTHFKNVA